MGSVQDTKKLRVSCYIFVLQIKANSNKKFNITPFNFL